MPASSSNAASKANATVQQGKGLWRPFVVVFATLLVPVVAAVLFYQLDSFDPAPIPLHELSLVPPISALLVNDHILAGAEFLGEGQLKGPEDIAYDPNSQLIYTGCEDGWIKQVAVNESSANSVVQNWVNTGGRPLGLVVGHNNELILKIQGEEKGEIERFVEDLPGYPDNILYDGEGHFWIALSSGIVKSWEMAFRYPFIRKIMALMEKYVGRPSMERNGGVFVVDLEGKPVAHYYDSELSMISSGIKIQNFLYCGSLKYSFIIRLNLDRYAATHHSSRK
ncbi:hypothetical protein SLEP1_g51382 [Rubroshorea leprosula]|uniref:Strictosidine synthase conserved region domain-containing protein n=2 Tax=Rubroshorea leprosula TaxID=152421 RepID=A0AAV5M3Z2_9ROSI|nr:hypothetical protein SLEP1_g51382 [Rubroshorea leprosula]